MLALVTDAYGGRGGIAQAARDVIGALAADPTVEAIDVLPRYTAEPPSGLPAKVHQRAAIGARIVYATASLAAARSSRPEVVLCNHLYMAPLARLAARITGAKLVLQLHGIEVWPQPTKGQRQALEAADLLLCVSRDTRARAIAHADLAPERAVVLNNTVDPRFAPGNRAAARAKFGLDADFALLAVGRLDARERYKGHDRVIAALPRLIGPGGCKPVFLVAGDGDDRARLEAAAASSGVRDRIRFLGQVPSADLPDLYRAADLFVLPSTCEGFGIVYLEAMASGTPALGLAVGGVFDALGDGELGRLVDPMADLSSTLQTAISAPRPDPHVLAASVAARVGKEAFQRRLALLLNLTANGNSIMGQVHRVTVL